MATLPTSESRLFPSLSPVRVATHGSHTGAVGVCLSEGGRYERGEGKSNQEDSAQGQDGYVGVGPVVGEAGILFCAVLRKYPDTETKRLRDLCFGMHRLTHTSFQMGIISKNTAGIIKKRNRQRKYIHGDSYSGIFSYTERMAEQAVTALRKITRDVERCDFSTAAKAKNYDLPHRPVWLARKVMREFLGLARTAQVPRALTVRYM